MVTDKLQTFNMWYQIKVVLWKNWIIRKRHWFLTLCEALIPVLLFVFIAYGRSKITAFMKKELHDVSYHERQIIVDNRPYGINLAETQLYYSPSNEYFEELISQLQDDFQWINNNIKGFEDPDQLLKQYARGANDTVVAIIFNSPAGSPNLDYTIRYHIPYASWRTNKLYDNEFEFDSAVGTMYYYQGFLNVQNSIDKAFMRTEKAKKGETLPIIEVDLLEFPHPPFKMDSGVTQVLIQYMPAMTLFSFMFVCPAVLKRVVEEKFSGIKELMRMIGMSSGILWFGWLVYSMIPMLLSNTLIVFLMKVDIFEAGYPAIEFTSASVFWVFLVLYCLSITVFCFFLSSWFSKPTLSTIVGILLWILTYFVPTYLLEGRETAFSTSMGLMLLPNMALFYAFKAISNFEIREIGSQWYNIHLAGATGANEVTMLNVMVMLIIDCIVYMLLALYVDGINPGKYGVPKSWYFPVEWIVARIKRRNIIHDEINGEATPLERIEKGNLPAGIELIHLTKVYGHKRVVDNLSLDIYQNQITVLLGHNGAGKSTTMGMITGMINKTSGDIIFRNAPKDGDKLKTIGLCPQHNLFFPDLTVREHLKFFAMLRGRSCQTAEHEINMLLKNLHLDEKRDELAHTLSGGMKRKLGLGMAIVGGSQILILDEPSSGMDPQSRRDMWDILLDMRKSKTILITTHFMDEADALGDWIAILNNGKKLCFGSPMFLKEQYKTGQHLNLLIEKNQNVDDIVKEIEEELRIYISEAKCIGKDGHEARFLLPPGNYYKMFEHLESSKDRLHIENISFVNTSLEDVFLKSKKIVDKEETDYKHQEEIDSIQSDNMLRLTLCALFHKKWIFLRRKIMTYVLPCLVSVAFLVLCIVLGQNAGGNASSGGPPLTLNLGVYGKSTVFVNASSEPISKKWLQIYKDITAEQKSDLHIVENVEKAIVDEGVKNLPFYRKHMVVAGEMSISNDHVYTVAMYNNYAIHAAPISFNLITNSIAKLTLGNEYSITTRNHPLDNLNTMTTAAELSEAHIGILWLMIMPLAFMFFLGIFILFPFVEISTNFTQIQFMCGVRPSVYWLVTYLFDMGLFISISTLLSMLIQVWFPFRGPREFGAIFLILFLYGLTGVPFSYLFARKKSFSGAYAAFIIMGLLCGVILTIITTALLESGDATFMKNGEIIRDIFMILLPQFGLTYSGLVFSRKVIQNYNFDHMDHMLRYSICNSGNANACCYGAGPDCEMHKSYVRTLSPYIYLMVFGAMFYLLLNIFLDSYTKKKCCNWLTIKYDKLFHRSDCVENCNQNLSITSGSDPQSTLRVKQLKKTYSGKTVVKSINLEVKKGQCFGLLGANGAGKTTTFKMLTKEEVRDDGYIKINDIDIENDKYLKNLGYCPQNDALNTCLTGRDILETIAKLRGVLNVKKYVELTLCQFGLADIADIPCEFYSGGNKRKLSFAVAIVGLPDFTLLDEPTNGVDPMSRRKFWTLIKNIKKLSQRSFVLTSHSMLECEALCDNLQIMKEGTIERAGTISKLKNEIHGFNAMIKLKNLKNDVIRDTDGLDDVDGANVSQRQPKTLDQLKEKLDERFNKQGRIKDAHASLIHYYIKSDNLKWSTIFGIFEELKEEFSDLIEDYNINEASLEDVFLSVARPDAET